MKILRKIPLSEESFRIHSHQLYGKTDFEVMAYLEIMEKHAIRKSPFMTIFNNLEFADSKIGAMVSFDIDFTIKNNSGTSIGKLETQPFK